MVQKINLDTILRYRWVIAFLFIILSFMLCLSQPVFLEKIAGPFETYKFSWRKAAGFEPKIDERIVVIAVDEPSVNILGRWPWSRARIARLIEGLNQADLVILDMVFSESGRAADDTLLADTIYENDNVILGMFFRDSATQETSDEAQDVLSDCALYNVESREDPAGLLDFDYIEMNLPALHNSAVSCAVFTTQPDADGLYRKYPIAYLHKGYVIPSLAIQASRFLKDSEPEIILNKHGFSEFKLDNFSLTNTNHFRLNFGKLHNTIPAHQIINGEISPDRFKNKAVYIGVTEVGLFDLRPTPVDPVLPGVHLHAAALDNILNNNAIEQKSWLDLVFISLSLFLIWVVSNLHTINSRIVFYICSIATMMLLSASSLTMFNLWVRDFYYIFSMMALAITYELLFFASSDIKNLELTTAFSSYVSSDLVKKILEDPDSLKLGGDEKEITILFSDIRNFTSLSESMEPKPLVSLLNQLFDPMTKAILNNQGMLDKYIGDAMMAFFNAPVEVPCHPKKACISALEITRIQAEEAVKLVAQGHPLIDIGIGINTGIAVVGNMGSTVRFNYTAIGDAVNLSARLEGLNKYYGTRIIISEFTKQKITDINNDFILRKLDCIRVVGKTEPVTIYEVMEYSDNNKTIKKSFEEALEKYFSGEFLLAAAAFEKLNAGTGDKPAKYFSARCREFYDNPPPRNWDGVYQLTKK